MVTPILPEGAFDGLRQRIESGWEHTIVLELEVVNQDGNEQWIGYEGATEELPCRMSQVGTKMLELAAAKGIQAEWVIDLELGAFIIPGQMRGFVRGETDGISWVRTVKITGDLGLTNRVYRTVLAVDYDFNQ